MEEMHHYEDVHKKPRGFAAMTPEKRRTIQQAGGRASHALGKAHHYTSEEAQAAGRLGKRGKAKKKRSVEL